MQNKIAVLNKQIKEVHQQIKESGPDEMDKILSLNAKLKKLITQQEELVKQEVRK